MSEPSQIIGQSAIRAFVFAGNATFTLRSKKTGEHFTFKVKANKEGLQGGAGTRFFISVLNGPDNNENYMYIGFIRREEPNRFIHGGAKAKASATAPSVVAFAWFWRRVVFPSGMLPPADDRLEIFHEGKCGRCGRKLTVPESIQTGLGPECASREALGSFLYSAETRAM